MKKQIGLLSFLLAGALYADFPSWDFESGLQSWSNANVTVSLTNTAHSGTDALLVTMVNTGVYDGVQVNISGSISNFTQAFSTNTIIELSAWVKIPDWSASNAVLKMAVRDVTGNKFTFLEKMETASGSGIQREDGWVKMRTTIPAFTAAWNEYDHDVQSKTVYTPQSLTLIVGALNKGVSFLLDDVSFKPMLPGVYSDYEPPSFSSPDDFLRPGPGADGCRLIDRFGDDVVLNGMNMWLYSDDEGDPESILWNYFLYSFSESDLAVISGDYGMNVLRLNLDHRWFERSYNSGTGVTTFKQEGFAWLDRMIQQAKTYGLYLILDFHAPPGGYQGPDGATATYFSDANLKKRTDNFWTAIAQRYRHEPQIAAYDLINEPRPLHNADWYNEAARLTAVIRQQGGDSNHLVLVEAPFPTDGNGFSVVRIADSAHRVMYDIHYYSPGDFTFNTSTTSTYVSTNTSLTDGIFGEKSFISYDNWDDTIAEEIVPVAYGMSSGNAVGMYTGQLTNQARSAQLYTLSGTNAAPVNIGEYGVKLATFQRAEAAVISYLTDLSQVMDFYGISRQCWNLRGDFGLYPTFVGYLSTDRLRNDALHNFFVSQKTVRAGMLVPEDADGDGMADVWERAHFGAITNASAATDADLDGLADRGEYIAGTDPLSSASTLKLTLMDREPAGRAIRWTSQSGRLYNVLWTDSLTNSFQTLETNLTSQSGWTDTVHGAESQGFYRIEARK